MPRLTVIMPARNAARTISAALRSTLRALPDDSEIAVWDDGSTDNTSDLVRTIGSPKIRLFRSDINRGSGVARKLAMENTDSDYVANMDSDDVCLPWRFRVQLPQLKHFDMVFSSAIKFSDSLSLPKMSQPLPVRAKNVRTSLLLGNPFPHSTMTAHRSKINEAGGYNDLKRAQDYDLWLRCAQHGVKVRKFHLPVVMYRVSQSQVSSKPAYLTQVKASVRLRENYFKLYRSSPNGAPRGPMDIHNITPDECSAIYEQLDAYCAELGFADRTYYKRLRQRGIFNAPF